MNLYICFCSPLRGCLVPHRRKLVFAQVSTRHLRVRNNSSSNNNNSMRPPLFADRRGTNTCINTTHIRDVARGGSTIVAGAISTGSIIARTAEAATTVGTPHRLEIQAAKVRIITHILLLFFF